MLHSAELQRSERHKNYINTHFLFFCIKIKKDLKEQEKRQFLRFFCNNNKKNTHKHACDP